MVKCPGCSRNLVETYMSWSSKGNDGDHDMHFCSVCYTPISLELAVKVNEEGEVYGG